MDKSSELDCYLYFMWNAWSARMCAEIFAGTCHGHLWDKWESIEKVVGATSAAAEWYLALDDGNRRRIREAAVKYYNKEG